MSDDAEEIQLAVRVNTLDPVELWLIRLRPKARPRYLAMLYAFLEYCGQSVDSVVELARQDRYTVCETLESFIGSLPDFRAEREFAYTAIRSYFTRCRIYLPTDPGYDVGGRRDSWWLRTDDGLPCGPDELHDRSSGHTASA